MFHFIESLVNSLWGQFGTMSFSVVVFLKKTKQKQKQNKTQKKTLQQ